MTPTLENREAICTIFSRHLAAMRSVYGLSQQQLGQLLGKSRQSISLVERGLLTISWDSILAILFLFEQIDSTRLPYIFNFLKEAGFHVTSLRQFVCAD